jgi:hypothetical protein
MLPNVFILGNPRKFLLFLATFQVLSSHMQLVAATQAM